jgi:hypothetical protein
VNRSVGLLAVLALVVTAGTSFVTVGGTQTGNLVPFGNAPYQDRYQQLYLPSAFPSDHPATIKRISFSSSPYLPGGTIGLDLVIRMGTATSVIPGTAFDLNIGQDAKVVFSGPITATLNGSPGDLAFQIKPFNYDPRKGLPLLVDVQLYGVSGGASGAFCFGLDPRTARVYRSLADGHVAVELGVGLLTTLEFVP